MIEMNPFHKNIYTYKHWYQQDTYSYNRNNHEYSTAFAKYANYAICCGKLALTKYEYFILLNNVPFWNDSFCSTYYIYSI